jgi:hypothetical protein
MSVDRIFWKECFIRIYSLKNLNLQLVTRGTGKHDELEDKSGDDDDEY